MLVIDKPAGFAVHKGPKGGESLEDYFDALRFGLPRAPALAHRLDRDTSGCLVLGRHRKALAELGRLFKARPRRQDLLGGGRGRAGGRRGPHRPAARPPGRHPRLVDEARPAGPAGGHHVEGAGADAVALPIFRSSRVCDRPCREFLPSPLWGGVGGGGSSWRTTPRCKNNDPPPHPSPNANSAEPGQARVPSGEGADRASGEASPHRRTAMRSNTPSHLARAGAADRPHASAARALRRHGLADPGRQRLRQRAAHRRTGLHLHAREIVVPLYKNRAPIQVTAPVPPHMQERLRACGWRRTRRRVETDRDGKAATINTSSPSSARARCGRAPGRPSCPR